MAAARKGKTKEQTKKKSQAWFPIDHPRGAFFRAASEINDCKLVGQDFYL